MANAYDFDEEPEDLPILPSQWRARNTAIGAIGQNPDHAARAIEISQGTGYPPGLIYPDLPAIDRDYKAKLTGRLIDSSPEMQEYANSEPLNSVVSTNDWGALSSLSSAIKKNAVFAPYIAAGDFLVRAAPKVPKVAEEIGGQLAKFISGPSTIEQSPLTPLEEEMRDEFAKRWKSGGAPDHLARKYAEADIMTIRGRQVRGEAIMALTILFAGAELTAGAAVLPQIIKGVSVGVPTMASIETAAEDLEHGFGIPKDVTTGALMVVGATVGIRHQVKAAEKARVTSSEEAIRAIQEGRMEVMPVEPKAEKPKASPLKITVYPIKASFDSADPYLKAGVRPPPGVDPLIDHLIADEAKRRAEGLDEVRKESDATETAEKSPETLANFYRAHPKAVVEIPASTIRELYGEKRPEAEDGLLGGIPDIDAKYSQAEASGGNVAVPWAEWFSRVSKETQDKIKIKIIASPGGVSVEESVALKEKAKAALNEYDLPEFGKEKGEAVVEDVDISRRREPPTEPEVKPGAEPAEPKVPLREMLWNNYFSKLVPDQLLNSEPLWSGARIEALAKGIPEWQAFSEIANETLAKMGSDFRLSPEAAKVFVDNARAVQLVRKQGRVEPAAALPGVKGIKLEQERYPKVEKDIAAGTHTFVVADQDGRPIGSLLLQEQRGGKDLYIEWFGASPPALHEGGGTGRVFGPKLTISAFIEAVKKFPNAERIGGYRVSGAREKTGTQKLVWIDADKFRKELAEIGGEKPTVALLRDLVSQWEAARRAEEPEGPLGERATWRHIDSVVRALTPKAWRPQERSAMLEGLKILNRILPDSVKIMPSATIMAKIAGAERDVLGLYHEIYDEFGERAPIVLFAVGSEHLWRPGAAGQFSVASTVRHEAIHALKRGRFLTKDEWAILRQAAIDNDWIKKHKIDETYTYADYELKLEEAVASEYGRWGSELRRPGFPENVRQIFVKMRELFEEIKRVWRERTGKDPTAEDLFKGVERGDFKYRPQEDIFARRAEEPAAALRGKEPQLPGMKEERPFEPGALGMSQARSDTYWRRVAETQDSDYQYALDKAAKAERKVQGAEWKKNFDIVRRDVQLNIDRRPDIVAADWLANGNIYGIKLPQKTRLRTDSLTEEQRQLLPEQYQAKNGMHADEAAGMFAFSSGKSMVDSLIALERSRAGTRFGEYVNKLIDQETTKRMVEEYGDLEGNVLREAQEHVATLKQLDILHEDTLRLATENGLKYEITKNEMLRMADVGFGQENMMDGLNTTSYYTSMGRAFGRIETALAKEKRDYQAVIKAMQERQFALLYAKRSAAFIKEHEKALRVLGQYQKTASLAKVTQEYTDRVHQLMRQVGIELKRTDDNLSTELGTKSFETWMKEKNDLGEGILDPMLARTPDGKVKPMDQWSVNEFLTFMEAINSIDYSGRRAKTIEVGNRTAEFNRAVLRGTTSIQMLGQQPRDPKSKLTRDRAAAWMRWGDAKLVKIEQLLDWMDHNDPTGIFSKIVTDPLFKAQYAKGDLIDKLGDDFKAIHPGRAWSRGLADVIANHSLKKPDSQERMRLTRENMVVIALNWGNKSNRDVLTRGMNWDEAAVGKFLNDHMTKDDWKFVEGTWKIFDEIAPLVEASTRKRYGVPINMVRPMEFDTPLGRKKGGYYPLIRDAEDVLYKAEHEAEMIQKPMLDNMPMARAEYERTGKAYPIDLTLAKLNGTISDTLHAALFQDPWRNAKKFLNDSRIRKGIGESFGPEYLKEIDAWMKDIAENGGERMDAVGQWLSRSSRENVTFVLMAFSIPTAFIHGLSAGFASAHQIGYKALAKELYNLGVVGYLPNVVSRFFSKSWMKNLEDAEAMFPGLRNRSHVIGRDMQAQLRKIVNQDIFDDLAAVRASTIAWGMKLVATLDRMTAAPVAVALYKKYRAEGMAHEDAVAAADKGVRQAHGEPSLVGRANIGRGEINKWLTIAYNGYWSHNYNRQRTGVKQITTTDPNVGTYDRIRTGTAMLVNLILAPTIIHWMFRGEPSEDAEDAAWNIGESLISQFTGGVPIVNTVMYKMMHGQRDVHMSPADQIWIKWADLSNDINSELHGKDAKHWLAHTLQVPALTFGIGLPNQGVRTMQFINDVVEDRQEPESVFQWAHGLVYGEAVSKKKGRH